jgi:SPRY domain-containing SOCS box protein 3
MAHVLRSYLSEAVKDYTRDYNVNKQAVSEDDRLKFESELEEQFKSTKCQIPFKNYKKLNWQWVINDENAQVLMSKSREAVMFHPVKGFGTTALRIDCPLKRNTYTYWQVTVAERVFGTSIMVGIGRTEAQTKSIGFVNLLGIDGNSWGLSHKGLLWHGNETKRYCNGFDECKTVRIGCLFNGFSGELAYFVNDTYMGVAFQNITMQQDLYPMISSTVSKCCMKLDFGYQTFPSLQEVCRLRLVENNVILKSIRVQYPYFPKFVESVLNDC